MYLWKCWRESRIVFGIALLLIAVMLATVTHGHESVNFGSHGDDLRQVAGLVVLFSYLQIVPLGFFAWMLGSFGVGREMGDGAGSFVFSRPRRRAYFLWSDWAFGMAQIAVIVILGDAVIGLLIHRLLLAVGDPSNGHIPYLLAGGPAPLVKVMAISATGAMLIGGLIFSVTYASTIVMRHARGVMLSLGLFVGYLVLGAVVHHYWEAVHFPSLILQVFFDGHGPHAFAGWEVAARSVLILVFPVLAQLSLERRELQ